jgi:hypothetical protein
MRRTFLAIFFCVGIQFLKQESKAQIPDSVRYRAQQAQCQMLLRIDATLARKVAEIQIGYQDSLARIFERLELDAMSKKLLMRSLDSGRIEKLKFLLDPKQISRINSHQIR